jgi:hypothetical protein
VTDENTPDEKNQANSQPNINSVGSLGCNRSPLIFANQFGALSGDQVAAAVWAAARGNGLGERARWSVRPRGRRDGEDPKGTLAMLLNYSGSGNEATEFGSGVWLLEEERPPAAEK